MRRRWLAAAAAPLMAGLVGCGGGLGSIGGPGSGSGFALEPARVTMLEGDTLSLRLVGGTGDETWAVGDTSVLTLVAPGVIAARGPGRSLVTVRQGGKRARAYVYVDRAVLVGAGDIAVCGYEADEATAALLDDIAGVIWTAGDNAYPSGTADNFQECYEPTWGRHRERTRPSPGNHEYRSDGAAPYFDYFGAAAGEPGRGWYSYRLGGWLVLALNSNFSYLPEETVAEEMAWLERVLAENPTLCTLAYFHHPLVSSGSHGNNIDDYDDENVKPFWDRLYAAGADVVLVGHDHHYERFRPLDPEGNPDPERGIRQFLVGTGGGALRGMGDEIHPHSELFVDDTHGVLELVLHEDGYEWQFVGVSGQGIDSGRDRCH